jgi:hypothetical protein
VEAFRTHSLTDAGPCTFVVADLVLKVREGGRVASAPGCVSHGSTAWRRWCGAIGRVIPAA